MLTAEQLQERSKGIGGSDAGAVLRLNPFKSPLDVYNDKLGISPPMEDTRFTYWGNALEDLIAQEYAKETGLKVRRRNATLRHTQHDFMVANIDRQVVGEKKVLECKTANEYTKRNWGPSGSDEVPDSYMIQCQHYMIVTGMKKADLAVLIGGSDFRIYHIDLNPKLANIITERENHFWNEHVLKEHPPAPYTIDELDSIYKTDSGESRIADDEMLLVHAELKSIKTQIKELSDIEETLKAKAKRCLDTAQRLTDIEGNTLFSWKSHSKNQFMGAALKKDNPGLYQQYCSESTVRPFKVH